MSATCGFNNGYKCGYSTLFYGDVLALWTRTKGSGTNAQSPRGDSEGSALGK
jgi:hypothetical protein